MACPLCFSVTNNVQPILYTIDGNTLGNMYFCVVGWNCSAHVNDVGAGMWIAIGY
jgi:hypothetical protein